MKHLHKIALFVCSIIWAQSADAQCLSGLTVATKTGGLTELRRCPQEITDTDVLRFSASITALPVAYLLTDEENNIMLVSASNKLDLSGLGAGRFRVWAFTYFGQIIAQPGQNAETAALGSICGQLSENFVLIENFGPGDCFPLQVLHNSNGGSRVLPEDGIGGVAQFRRKLDGLRSQAFVDDYYSILLSAGGSIAEAPELGASLALPDDQPFYDAVAVKNFGYDAIGLGNSDFDLGPEVLARFISDLGPSGFPPVVSANVDFSEEAGLQALVDAEQILSSKIVFRGETPIGIIGITTPELEDLSNPGNVKVNDQLTEIVQAEVDAFLEQGIPRIILLSHLNDVEMEVALAATLSGVDVILAGGGEELLANDPAVALPGLEIAGAYPLRAEGADGQPVYIVGTPGRYRFLGQLLLVFDPEGNIRLIDERSGPVMVETNDPNALLQELVEEPVAAWLADPANDVPAAIKSNEGDTVAAALSGKAGEPLTASDLEIAGTGIDLDFFPNPASEQMTVRLELEKGGPVRIALSNMLGQMQTKLFEGRLEAGRHQLTYPLGGQRFEAGVYLLCVRIGDELMVKRLGIY